MGRKNRIKLIISIICFSFLILNINSKEANALFGLGSKKQKINYPFPTDKKSFKSKALEIHKKDAADPSSEFKLIIPNDWAEDTSIKSIKTFSNFGTLGKDLTSEIASFKGPLLHGDRVTITIKKAQLFHEISAKYWLERYMNIHNYLPLGKITENGNKEAAVSFTYIDANGFSKKTKIRALINGNEIFLAEFNSPADFDKPLEFLQNATLYNFKLVNITDSPIEKTKSLYMSGAIDIRYPESWDLYKLDTNDLNNMVLQLHNIKESSDGSESSTLNGIIEISAIKRNSNTNLMREARLLKERLEESMDVKFDKVQESTELNANKRFIFSRYESYIAKRNDNNKVNREIHISVLGDEDWYILSFLYTPLQSEDSYNWARNVQSFKTITEDIM